uniref:RRM domain-containing protein n=1 Tax=Strongyloides papillosus TaxID=174720 RepID=A0A0N5BAQ9_STREA
MSERRSTVQLPENPPYKVYVGNLPYDAIQGDMDDIFKDCDMVEVKMVRDRETDKFKGYAYVEFRTREDLAKALQFNGYVFVDRTLRIDIANTKSRDGGSMNKRGGGFSQQKSNNHNTNQRHDNKKGNGYNNRNNPQDRNERIQNGKWVNAHPSNRRRGNSTREYQRSTVEVVDDPERPKLKLQPRTTDPEELARIKHQQEEEEAARVAKIFGKNVSISKEK